MPMTAVTMVVSAGMRLIWRTKDWSIFSVSIGNVVR